MKRFLLIVPVSLLILLNACGNPETPVGGTFITFTPTIGPPPTPTTDGSTLVALLNQTIEGTETPTPLDQLEHSISAKYQVLDVMFSEADGTPAFVVKINCECAGNGQCCSHEQTFVEAMRAMYANSNQIIPLVPGQVKDMRVYCYDHSSQLVVVYVLWEDVRSFFNGTLTGYQLASRVKH